MHSSTAYQSSKGHTTRGFRHWLKREVRHYYLRVPRPCRYLILCAICLLTVVFMVGAAYWQALALSALLVEDGIRGGGGGGAKEGGAGSRGVVSARGTDAAVFQGDLLSDTYFVRSRRLARIEARYNAAHAATADAQERHQYTRRGFYNATPVGKGGWTGERVPGAFRQVADVQLEAWRTYLMEKGGAAEANTTCSPAQEALGVCAEAGGPVDPPLPGLRTAWRRYTPVELMSRHGHMDFIYAFVNGTELNHVYRRFLMGDGQCFAAIRAVEAEFWQAQRSGASAAHTATLLPAPCTSLILSAFDTGGALLAGMEKRAVRGTNERDRETDELRHSLRSVEQHIRWHRGRVVMVSPGHHPQWMDGAKNFLAGTCGGAVVAAQRERGAHLRMTTVHQDAIMPYGMKLTANSHIIEQHLWRVRNVSSVHVYFNDDYFVNRDVQITDLFNEYGGTIIRAENAFVREAKVAGAGQSWLEGVYHTHLFNVLELDVRREDYLPAALVDLWDSSLVSSPARPQRGQLLPFNASSHEGAAGVAALQRAFEARVSNNDYQAEVAQTFSPENLSSLSDIPMGTRRRSRMRLFASHSPFVYCTNMFRHLNLRYEREFAHNAMRHRVRVARDLFVPFLYNAFTMARPWQASPKFLPFLLRQRLAAVRGQTAHGEGKGLAAADGAGAGRAAGEEETVVYLDNEDGCAPATLLFAPADAHIQYTQMTNDLARNSAAMEKIAKEKPIFFNVNAGFTSPEATQQLSDFLRTRYAQPTYLERGTDTLSAGGNALPPLYEQLMKLPVILVTSFAEGLCPMVRSLQLALRDHEGVVLGVVARHGTGGESDATLAALRAKHAHPLRSAMPAVACAFNSRVHIIAQEAVPAAASVEAAAGGEALVRLVQVALAEGRKRDLDATAAVKLPGACRVRSASPDGSPAQLRAIVVDGRAGVALFGSAAALAALRHAVTMPGQTLALEDFDLLRVGDGQFRNDAALVLSRRSAEAKAVHWIDGAAENDLLLSYPVPFAPLEHLDVALRFVGE